MSRFLEWLQGLAQGTRASIMYKALIGPLVMLLFMIGIGVFTITQLSGVEGRMRYVADDLTPATAAATDLMRAMYQERVTTQAFVADSTEDNRVAWERSHEATLRIVERAQADFAGTAHEAEFVEAVEVHGRYAETFRDEVAPTLLAVAERRDTVLEPTSDAVRDRVVIVMEGAYGVNATNIGETAASLVHAIMAVQVALDYYLRTGNGERELRDAVDHVTDRLQVLDSSIGPMDHDFLLQHFAQRVAGEVEEAIDGWVDYTVALDVVIAQHRRAMDAIHNRLNILGPVMTDEAQDLQSAIFAELDELSAETSRETARALVLVGASIIVGGLIALLVSVAVTRGVIRPLIVTNRNIDEMLNEIEAGQGDLTRRLPVSSRDEVGQLATNFNRFVETLQNVVRNITDETNQVATAAEELSAVTSQTSAGVQRQNLETDQVATAMNEMTATVQEIARNAAEASHAAADADQSAGEGRRVVEATVASIERLVELMETGGQSVDRLNADVDSITTIIDVIHEVAEQTNLLALNAAIEAARAGDQGRGFAVVADEVRNLAQKTQESTHRIQELIETLQTGAKSAVSVIGQGREQGRSTVEYAGEAGEALARIDTKVQAIRDMNAQIASAAEEQTAVSNDISESIERIRDVAMETAGGAEQTASSSEELARLGERVKQLVGQFRV